MRLTKRLAALAVALTTLAAAGLAFAQGPNPLPADTPWFKPYEEPVTARIGASVNIAQTFPEGDSYSHNVWTRGLLEQLNINVDVVWEAPGGSDYETKLNLAIASNDLPDIILTANYAQFMKLYNAGKLADLTGLYEEYAYPVIQENLMKDGGQSLSWGVLDGKRMGMPAEGASMQQVRLVWIRADWLEELGLEEPKTMEDVLSIAKAFKDADPDNRVGMPFFKAVIGDGMCDIQGVANAYGAFPRIWIDDGEGGLKYGSIQPEFRKAIEIYADLYKDGYIDPAFASLDGGKVGEQLTTNKIGVIIGNSWLSSWPLNTLYDTDKVDWHVYPLLMSETIDTPVKTQVPDIKGAHVVVRAGYEHPELLFKWLNFSVAKTNDPLYAEPYAYHSDPPEIEHGFGYHMLNPLYVYYNDPMLNFNTQPHVTAAIDTGDLSSLTTAHDETQYANVKKWFDKVEAGEQPSGNDWNAWLSWYGPDSTFAIMNRYIADGSLVYNQTYGYFTDTMVKEWGSLTSMENEYVTQIIAGARPIEDFDEFVETWLALGGEDIIKEINEWHKAK
ncbi:MAG: extracellular solute-binding protein [Oscillospiraceae bacterium]|jgi:putative aldouronate transport system substrate-binding protein|nr:extracellular solute-binding protein [Oscillospiraceae bacterium]